MTSASLRRIGAAGRPAHASQEKAEVPAATSKQTARPTGTAQSVGGPGLGSFLRAPDTAARDVMRVCNQIKRMASLVVTASESGHGIDKVLEKAEDLTETVLDVLGYDKTEPQRLDSVRPMIMEAVCALMADAAKAGEDPLNEQSPIASALISVARSRGMARAIDRAWPTGVEEAAAVRVAAVNALTPVTLEALSFDFFHPHGELMKESAAILYEVVQQTVVTHTPEAATDASKMVLTQSLLQSGGRVMASVWNMVADDLIDEVNGLSDTDRRARIEMVKTMSSKDVLKPVREKFSQVFAEMVISSDQLLSNKSPETYQIETGAKGRSGVGYQAESVQTVQSKTLQQGKAQAIDLERNKPLPATNQRVVLRRPGGMGPK